ncbi:two component transcriptional regulator, winged helix family [Thermodesulfatator indicus DSM 15286]|uniref:Two component transcriptional regulator, winged helix family n=1 Tax=Thermodesulfatator indicus (strain DSM 15286 / JCM 11887 / CIR29812) TaxID=667014 RepID=F8AA67_THEID|nr:response regulator transcription factor [Thermodesulfatator indicus]AEH46068.1 two component transcriptional regulator, winged helix family [Thermodesulfatator indicus DSM 15286]
MHPKAKILIIEDDLDIIYVLKEHLELDGFEVLEAENGLKGLELVEQDPDLIILDLNLPDIDGIKLCQKIRQKSDVPIIMLTARDSLSDKVRGLESGADDYLVKPFEYLEILARIKACLRRAKKIYKKKEILELGIFKIDFNRREVNINGKTIRLTKKEFDLLKILAAHANEVLTRDFIRSQLWPGKEIYPWSRALDVHIQRLRQKIEPDPENPRYIITHPGVGYRFNPEGD